MIGHRLVVANPIDHPKPAGKAHEHKEQKMVRSDSDAGDEVI
jgi:hypothetical protein